MSSGNFFLGSLDSVDVLKDLEILSPPSKYCRLELGNVHGFEVTAAYGEVVEVGLDLHLFFRGRRQVSLTIAVKTVQVIVLMRH